MLDDSDYATHATAGSSDGGGRKGQGRDRGRGPAAPNAPPPSPPPAAVPEPEPPERLWTSKDRVKYRRQRRLRQEQERREREQMEEQRRRWQAEDEDEGSTTDGGSLTDGTTEDDGLGYTLPNLPVYMSDSEGASDEFDMAGQQPLQDGEPPPPSAASQFRPRKPGGGGGGERMSQSGGSGRQMPPQQQQQQQQPQGHPYHPQPPVPYGYHPQSGSQQQQQHPQAPPMGYPYPYPPGMYGQYGQQQQQYAAQYAAWAAAQAGSGGYPPQPYPGFPPRPYPQQPPYGFAPRPHAAAPRGSAAAGEGPGGSRAPALGRSEADGGGRPGRTDGPGAASASASASEDAVAAAAVVAQPSSSYGPYCLPDGAGGSLGIHHASSLAEAGSNITFDSIQKLTFVVVAAVIMSYCAVSPRTLPIVEYNLRFKENLRIVSLVILGPLVAFISVFDVKKSDINSVIRTFTCAFTVGYLSSFMLELVFTTLLRLGVFLIWEPAIFQLTPRVPSIVLPWVLRENRYRPKRITLFAADFASSCIAAPIIEEYMKLKVVQLSVRLPRNFVRVKRRRSSGGKKSGKKKKKRYALERIEKGPGESDVTNVNAYVSQMLAASMGIKLCDSVRRILMYTKKDDASKSFYAFARGVFPIHEICGTMTALELAKRDLLGVDMPSWRLLLLAVVIHGMANFRGMKPVFKWNSSTPWSEMQLSPWNVADDSTFAQLLNKGFAKLLWLIILGRALGYCTKNYYLISRQAVKRTTTYAGNHSAFSAELATADMLKKAKKKEK